MTKKIAFIGLGKLGASLAEKLMSLPDQLLVYNRSKAKTTPFAEKGASVADSIAEVAATAEIIFTNVIDDKALTEVSEELLAQAKKPFIHVSTSTILPTTASTLAEKHAHHKVDFISSPVLGTPEKVRANAAKIFCSGTQAAFHDIEPILKAITGDVFYLSADVSHAYVMKICMNYTLVTAIEMTSELYAFAEKSGFDTSIIKDALKQIYANPIIHYYIDKIHQRDYHSVNFDIEGGYKDVTLFETAFANAGVNADIASIVKGKFVQALANDQNKLDWSAIGDIIRTRSGLD